MAQTTIHNFDLKKLIAFAETAKGDMFLEKRPRGMCYNLKSRLTPASGAVQRHGKGQQH